MEKEVQFCSYVALTISYGRVTSHLCIILLLSLKIRNRNVMNFYKSNCFKVFFIICQLIFILQSI